MSENIILKGTEKLLRPLITNIMALHQLISSRDIGNVYGVPVQSFQEMVRFKPQIHLYFEQQTGLIDPEFGAVTAQISFRILNETPETMTPIKAQALGVKINEIFGGTTPFSWVKSKHLYSYHAPHQGVQTKVYTNTEIEAKRLIRNVLRVQNLELDDKYFKDATKVVDLATPADGGREKDFIYGESRRRPRRLPEATVTFSYAEMLLHGLPNAITLCDVKGTKQHSLVKGWLPSGV